MEHPWLNGAAPATSLNSNALSGMQRITEMNQLHRVRALDGSVPMFLATIFFFFIIAIVVSITIIITTSVSISPPSMYVADDECRLLCAASTRPS